MSAANEANANPLTREEIRSLSRPAMVALAARCAMRVEPLLGSEGDFHYWGKNALVHVRSIRVAISSVVRLSILGGWRAVTVGAASTSVRRAAEAAEAARDAVMSKARLVDEV